MSAGASNDFQRATEIARRMVTEFGMSDKLGPMQFGGGGGQVFLGRDIQSEQNYSDEFARLIDLEVQKIINDAYARCKEILLENQDKLNLIAETLKEVETLDAEQIKSLMEHGRLPDRPAKSETDSELSSDDVKVNINTKKESEEEKPQGEGLSKEEKEDDNDLK